MLTVEEVQEKYGAIKGSDVDPEQPSLILFSTSIEGNEATGKTRMPLLTYPWPLVHINYGDRDATHFLYEMSPERRAATTLYNMKASTPEGWTRAEARDSLTKLQEILVVELAEGHLKGGTVILDSASSWDSAIQEVLVAPALEEELTEGKQKRRGGLAYSKRNLAVRGTINWLKNQGCFVVLTHQKKPKWAKDGPIPGVYEAKMNNEVGYLVEIRVDLQKLCARCGSPECEKEGHIGRRHVGRIVKFGKNTAMEGMVIEGLTFETLYAMYAGSPFPDEKRLQ